MFSFCRNLFFSFFQTLYFHLHGSAAEASESVYMRKRVKENAQLSKPNLGYKPGVTN